MVRVKPMFVLLQALGWALFLAIAYVEDSVPELLQLAGVVAMSICGLLGSLALRLVYRKLQADGYGELRWLVRGRGCTAAARARALHGR
ncbi:hypothetical protein JH274_10370 [Xanthomonas campestris pv. incanae]|uniref:hypothetical protein n=1 Tax=Xanthomonas campestris TaxID=339 RepID=UPI002367F383|nr:hypothetical protein [Xanthomonas campestris]WDK27593.1 hypothetical protein JH274_10370 [Xanthomonas campestris pv. incanae]